MIHYFKIFLIILNINVFAQTTSSDKVKIHSGINLKVIQYDSINSFQPKTKEVTFPEMINDPFNNNYFQIHHAFSQNQDFNSPIYSKQKIKFNTIAYYLASAVDFFIKNSITRVNQLKPVNVRLHIDNLSDENLSAFYQQHQNSPQDRSFELWYGTANELGMNQEKNDQYIPTPVSTKILENRAQFEQTAKESIRGSLLAAVLSPELISSGWVTSISIQAFFGMGVNVFASMIKKAEINYYQAANKIDPEMPIEHILSDYVAIVLNLDKNHPLQLAIADYFVTEIIHQADKNNFSDKIKISLNNTQKYQYLFEDNLSYQSSLALAVFQDLKNLKDLKNINMNTKLLSCKIPDSDLLKSEFKYYFPRFVIDCLKLDNQNNEKLSFKTLASVYKILEKREF